VLGWIVVMKGDKKLLGSDHSDQNGEGEIDKRRRRSFFPTKAAAYKRVLHFTIYANQSKKKLLNYSHNHFGANGCIEAAAC